MEENKIQHSKPVPPFVRFCAANIPMVFDDSLSYYEALCALWNWLQTDVIDVINNNARVTEVWREELTTFENNVTEEIEGFETVMRKDFADLVDLFNQLQAWIDNYFDNLDVQEEINNKLDAMVEAGTLQEIITTYIQSNVAWTFDTVADMKNATNLVNGSFAQTLGFYNINDGGGALYKITNSGTANEMDIIAVGDLLANLVKNSDTINVRQVSITGDGVTDNYAQFDNLASVINAKGYKTVIFNPEHYMLSSPVDFSISTKDVTLDFNGSTVDYYPSVSFDTSKALINIIYPINSVGTSSEIKNGNFITSAIVPDWTDTGTYPSGSGCIVKSTARIAKFDNLHFENIFFGYAICSYYGSLITITNCTGIDVGGRSADNDYDSRGDAIYLGYSGVVFDENDQVDTTNSLPVNILVENCNFKGYEAIEGSGSLKNRNHSGRCGIVACEFSVTNKEKQLKVNNCYFYNYQRGIHREYCDNITMEVSNSKFEECAEIAHGCNNFNNIQFNNCEFNKTINLVPIDTNYQVLAAGASTNVCKNIEFNNCIATGYAGYLTLYCKGITVNFNSCHFEVEELKAMTLGVINFNDCYIKANVANKFYRVAPNFYNCYIELGYKNDANSSYKLTSNSVEALNSVQKEEYFENNQFVNVTLREIVNDIDVYVDKNSFTFDANYTNADSFIINIKHIKSFCYNKFNNTCMTSDAPLSGYGLTSDYIQICNNTFIGCNLGFYQASDYKITLRDNKFINGTVKSLTNGTDLNQAHIICSGNMYTGYSGTPLVNTSGSTCYNNYSISGNTATLIP